MELHISLTEVIGVIICIAVLLWLLNRYLFQPITKILDKRREILQSSRDKAEQNFKKLESKINQYKSTINMAREEAEEIQKEAFAQAIREKGKIKAEAEKQGQKLIAQKLKYIQKEEDKAKILLDKEVSLLAKSITKTILKQ